MTTINYQFSDGHYEEIEVTEEFKKEYEFLLVKEQAHYWKEMKQKQRAGMRCVSDLSLDKYSEDGYDLPSAALSPLEECIIQEDRDEFYQKLFAPLTEKQRKVYVLHHLYNMTQTEIADKLGIAVSSVNERLQTARKNILENFLQNPKI